MKTKFNHSPLIHLLALGLVAFFSWMAYRSSVDPFARGGFLLRGLMVGGCGMLALMVVGLYLRGGINRYFVEETGLKIQRLGHSTFHPWSDIRRIELNSSLHYLVIYGHEGALALTTTDYFPHLKEFIRAIHSRSRCELSPQLAEKMTGETNEVDAPIIGLTLGR